MQSTLVKFYGETDQEHTEIIENLDLYYRVQYLSFRDDGEGIEPNYLSHQSKSNLSKPQYDLLEKIRYLSKANVVVSVQSLMDSLGVSSPLTILNTLNNLSEQKAILNFTWPELEL